MSRSLLDTFAPSLAELATMTGTKRTHRIEDDEEDSPAQLKARILGALRERQPLDRKQLSVQLNVDETNLGIALGNMRVNQEIHAVRGVGYYVGPKPPAAEQPGEMKMAVEKITDRSRVLAFVGTNAGAKPAAMAAKLSIGVDTLYQHLAVLRRQGKIIAADGGGWKQVAGDEGSADVKPAKRAKRGKRKPQERATKAAQTRRVKPIDFDQARAGEPTFIVDDAGRVAILHDEVRIDLSMGATKRLVAFLDKHAK